MGCGARRHILFQTAALASNPEMKKPCETKVSQGFFLSRRLLAKTEMHRRPAGWSIDMKVDLGLRLVAAPGTCAMAKQKID